MVVEALSPLPARRILVVRYRFIGDTILTVPFLRNLRYAYPEATIDVLVGPQSGKVLEGCPYVNNLIPFDTTRFHKYDRGPGKARNFLSYIWELRKKKYDLVFLLKRSLSALLLSFFTGAKFRVGYGQQFNILLTHPVVWKKNQHEVESTLDVLKAIAIPVMDDYLESWLSQSEREAILSLVPELSLTNKKVLIHAAAAHPDKTYPLEHWSKIIRKLHTSHKICPFFTGAAEDNSLYQELQDLSGIKGVNLAGYLSLRQSLALMEHMDLAICVDSGPAHLAAATNTPTIALFGPTDPVRWRPWGQSHTAIFDSYLACRPCNYHKVCEDRPCLTKMDPSQIIRECEAILGSASVGNK